MDRDADLQRAFELIEQDSLEEAQEVLDAVLASDANNPDAWWLYAHAVTDPQEAQRALQNVTRLDPTYPGARSLLETLGAEMPVQPVSRASAETTETDFSPDFLDNLNDDDLLLMSDDADDFDFTDVEDDDLLTEEPQPGTPGRRILLALIALLVLVVAVVLVFVVNPFRPVTDAPATQQVAGVSTATEEPTVQIIAPASETPPGLPPGGFLEGIYNAVGDFPVVDDSAAVEQTSAGSALTVSVCTESRRALRTFVPQVMQALASTGNSLQGRFDVVGARFLNCDNNATLLFAAMRVDDAIAYTSGDLSARELETRFISLQP